MTDSWIQGFSVKGFYGQIYHHDYKTIVKISKVGDSHFRFCILELSGDIDWVAIESHNYIILQLNCTDIRVVLQFPNQVLTTWTFLIRKKNQKGCYHRSDNRFIRHIMKEMILSLLVYRNLHTQIRIHPVQY